MSLVFDFDMIYNVVVNFSQVDKKLSGVFGRVVLGIVLITIQEGVVKMLIYADVILTFK